MLFEFDAQNHPWFSGIDWDYIRDSTAPYIPEVSSPTDTSNFDVDDTDLRSADVLPPTANAVFSALHLPFLGFTYTQGRFVVWPLPPSVALPISPPLTPPPAFSVGLSLPLLLLLASSSLCPASCFSGCLSWPLLLLLP